jgi:acetyltransferase
MNLNKLFNPRSVAVIGAIDDPKKIGFALMYNLTQNKKIKIYPVNPTVKKVFNLACHKSVKSIKTPIDLAVIAIKPEFVPIVLKECGEKNIPHAIIITAGYKEIGSLGEERENELKKIAKKYKINIIGPNCLGVMDTRFGLNATFGNDLPRQGNTAVVSQSGAIGTAMLDWAENKNIGFSKFISIGNQAGATENDFLEYLGNDKNTKAIVMYLESLSNGRRFFDLAKKITAKKPIVVIKAGISQKGSLAASSHTGSIASSHEIFKTACRQSGIKLVDSLDEMFNLVRFFDAGIFEAPSNWVVLTNGGGPSIVLTDLLETTKNLSLATIEPSIKNALKKVLPDSAALNNPIDIIGDASAERYDSALKILTKNTKFGIIVLLTPQKLTQINQTAKIIFARAKKQLIIPLFIGGEKTSSANGFFQKNKLINFYDPLALVKCLSKLAGDVIKSDSAMHNAKTEEPLRQMSFDEASILFSKYNLKITGDFINKKNDLERCVKKINFPWAMKVSDERIIHKTDVSGVKININSLDEAKKSWMEIENSIKKIYPNIILNGFVIQPMKKGVEVIVGAKRDKNFGPVILFGMGGIFVEIYKDTAMRLAPINFNEAKKMIDEVKGSAILKGARGMPAVDVNGLAKIIVSISKIISKEKKIMEIDLNPVFAGGDGNHIVDARIMLKNGKNLPK